MGTSFITFKDWSERTTPDLKAAGILRHLYDLFSQIQEAQVFIFNPPSIQGLGTVGGFEFWIENRGGSSYQKLEEITKK